MSYDLTYLSFGAGVQSTALLAMSALGLHGCPKADIAVFADTGDEPNWVYDHVVLMADWGSKHGIPVFVTAKTGSESLSADCLRNGRWANVPAFTRDDKGKVGMLRRQCTREYKIEPLERFVRTYMGYKPRQWMKHKVQVLMGISTDEVGRMKPARTHWVTAAFPLIDAGLSREDCARLITEVGLPMPRKSACVFCPFHDNEAWRALKNEAPDEFEKAAQFDDGIRDMSKRGVNGKVYVHRSCIPLREIDFSAPPDSLKDGFQNECEGHCGV